MAVLLVLTTLYVLLVHFVLNDDNTDKCPSFPHGCRCQMKSRGGIRLTCKGLQHVNFSHLPQDVNIDIDLSNNQLQQVNRTMFPHPNKIRKLNLRNNKISEIKAFSFEGFNALKKLDLSDNELSSINENTFAGLESITLAVLNLNRNRILSVSQRAFTKMKISKLILSNQLNISGDRADLVGYHDFLTLSLVKNINLDGNKLLCDCNLRWLITWVRANNFIISRNTTCHYPPQLRGESVAYLVGLDTNNMWNCDEFYRNFSLPFFLITPSRTQLLLENDSLFFSCHATWINSGYFVWKRNGISQDKDTHGVYLRHFYNVATGLHLSTLKIAALQDGESHVSCHLIVPGSGEVTASTKVIVFNSMNYNKTCGANTTTSGKGSLFWGTALLGSTIQMMCPYGGLTNSLTFRSCLDDGTWEIPMLADCYFGNKITHALQRFYNNTKSNNAKKIVQTAKIFDAFFRKYFLKVSNEYDLFFIHGILHKIMSTYQKNIGIYAKFFWGTLGLISQTYTRLDAMNEVLYGSSNRQRFRSLMESFLQQEARKRGNFFRVNNHPNMASLAYKQMEAVSHCYIRTPPSYRQLINIDFSAKGNKTLYRSATVHIQVIMPTLITDVRIITAAFRSNTFFRQSIDNDNDQKRISPFVGLKIDDTSSRKRINTTHQVSIKFKNKFNGVRLGQENVKLLVLQNEYESRWREHKYCTILEDHPSFFLQFDCHFPSYGNTIYFFLGMKHSTGDVGQSNYMEIVLYISAIISCAFLTFTIFCYLLLNKLRVNKSDAVTLMNLCIAFLVSELLFSLGVYRTNEVLLCKGVGIALHYFLLCAIVWLGCGGVVLIRVLKKKNREQYREYDPVLKYYLVGWGLPLIICSVTVAYDRNNYVTSSYCWLTPKSALAAFICPASLILLTDLIILCCLHATINRIYPESNEMIEEDKNISPVMNRKRCNVNSCKIKGSRKVGGIVEEQFLFPKRPELITYLHGSLSVLLLFSLTFTFTLMMYSYKNSGAKYLYFLFSYASAFCNFLLGLTIWFFHCLRKRNIFVYFIGLFMSCCSRVGNKTNTEDQTEKECLVENTDETEVVPKEIARFSVNSEIPSEARSNYCTGDLVVSDSSPVKAESREACDGQRQSFDKIASSDPLSIITSSHPNVVAAHNSFGSDAAIVLQQNHTNVVKEHCTSSEAEAPIFDDCQMCTQKKPLPSLHSEQTLHTAPELKMNEQHEQCVLGEKQSSRKNSATQKHPSQSDMSEVERSSVGGHNSIGECSLVSDNHKRRVRPVNPEIPDNLKNFVPNNWKPARRRKRHKTGESYYPYFNTDINALNASYAYSSKSSSIASTTIGGVPLYVNKHVQNNIPIFPSALSQPQLTYTHTAAVNVVAQVQQQQCVAATNNVQLQRNFSQNHSSTSSSSRQENNNNNNNNNVRTVPATVVRPNTETPVIQRRVSRPVQFPTSPVGSHKQFPGELPSSYPAYNNAIPVNVVKPLPREKSRGPESSEGSSVDLNNSRVNGHSTPRHFKEEQIRLSTDRTTYLSGRISEETEEIEEKIEEIKVVPIIYVPVPHVSIKQFQNRSETSV